MEPLALLSLTNRLKERVGHSLASILASEEFKEEVVRKPSRNIKDLKVKSASVLEVGRLEKYKSSALKYLGAFELSKHASHHVLSSCLVNGVFMATGHADSTFKLWLLNPHYFDTSFSTAGQKIVTSDEVFLSGTGSGTTGNFKKRQATEMKPDSQVLPLELVASNEQLYTSPPEFHKYFVTALACVFRKAQNQIVLVSGDASGDLAVSEVAYSTATQKLEAVELLFRRKAHQAAVSQLELTAVDDVIVSASHDGSIWYALLTSFWDLDMQAKLLAIEEHEEPILSLRFADKFAWMVSASKSELLLWTVEIQANPEFERAAADKENEPPAKTAPARFVVQAK